MRIKRRMGMGRTIFHIVNRGARKVNIFSGDEERGLFVRLLAKCALKHHVEIVAWCLMSNHYHLETASEGTPLTRMMHDLDGAYSRIYNRRHQMTGCLFQGPFRSFSIEDRDGMAYVSRYIHCNPVDMGFAPDAYPWSSARSYLGIAPVPEWLNPMPVLEMVGGSQKYQEYLRQARRRAKNPAATPDVMEDFLRDYLCHLEERILGRIAGLNGRIGQMAPQSLVTWAALRIHGIPARVVADYYGYASTDVLHASMSRLDRRLGQDPELNSDLRRVAIMNSSVKEIASLFP